MEGDSSQRKSTTGKRQKGGCKPPKKSRAVENVLKTLNDVSDSQKLGTLAMKYVELDTIYQKSKESVSALEKQSANLLKEKEQLASENGKQLLSRNHLEGLCRELYRLNKLVKEDSVTRLQEEEERRKAITSKFETTLADVTSMMQENTLKNNKLREDNLSMAKKMKILYQEFEGRKEEHEKIDHQLNLERRLTQVQMEKAQLEIQAERSIWEQERNSLINKWKQSESSCMGLQFIVEDLRKRMEVYEERHLGYKSAIDTNNKFFDSCKTEIRATSKKVGLMEKEIIVWKERSQQNALKAMDISLMKQAQDTQLATALRKVESLQNLSRQLQEDRSTYLKQLQANGIEPSSETNIAKGEIELAQKEQLLKPVKHQLDVIRMQCVAKKDQISFNALQSFLEMSKSLDSVNAGINLSLGFINFITTTKKKYCYDNFYHTPSNHVNNLITSNGDPNFSCAGPSESSIVPQYN